MTVNDLYFHSFDVVYNTNPNEEVSFFPIKFPDDVTIPANTTVTIDMKMRVNLFSSSQARFIAGIVVVPHEEVKNTPLVNMLSGMPINDGEYASDLYLSLRNISNTDYDITAGTSLFSLIHGAHLLIKLKQVADDHLTMELRPVE